MCQVCSFAFTLGTVSLMRGDNIRAVQLSDLSLTRYDQLSTEQDECQLLTYTMQKGKTNQVNTLQCV